MSICQQIVRRVTEPLIGADSKIRNEYSESLRMLNQTVKEGKADDTILGSDDGRVTSC